MATTTPNFGFDIPQSTDLVKDGATAIAALGTDIDTAFVDLKGGTTGQVLSKNSNTDLDFTWVAQDDSNAIQNAIVDAKGDLISATAADTPARLAVGTNGQFLAANSSTSTGLEWQTISAGGMTSLATGTLSGVEVSITSISQDYIDLYLVITSFRTSSANKLGLRINNNTGSNYEASWTSAVSTSITSSGSTTALDLLPANMYTSDYDDSCFVRISNYKSADSHTISGSYSLLYAGNGGNGSYYVNLNGAITSLQIRNLNGTSTFGGGTYTLYGVK